MKKIILILLFCSPSLFSQNLTDSDPFRLSFTFPKENQETVSFRGREVPVDNISGLLKIFIEKDKNVEIWFHIEGTINVQVLNRIDDFSEGIHSTIYLEFEDKNVKKVVEYKPQKLYISDNHSNDEEGREATEVESNILTSLCSLATRIRVKPLVGEGVLFELTDQKLVREFVNSMRIQRVESLCLCLGSSLIEIWENDLRVGTVSVHHGKYLRFSDIYGQGLASPEFERLYKKYISNHNKAGERDFE